MFALPGRQKKAVSLDLNLLPEDPFFATWIGKSLRWAVSVGRYVVMFTELIVIVSFATRFNLDRQLTDLNDSINQKQVLIESFGELEANVLNVQSRLEQYQQLSQQQNLADVFPALSAIIPVDVTLSSLSVKPTAVSLAGITQSQSSLNLLVNNIQLSGKFFNVSIESIETNPDDGNQLIFRLSADTQPPAVKKTAATKTEAKVDVLDRTQGL